jgi:hypothetical protein
VTVDGDQLGAPVLHAHLDRAQVRPSLVGPDGVRDPANGVEVEVLYSRHVLALESKSGDAPGEATIE